jgi:hypothetical protein
MDDYTKYIILKPSTLDRKAWQTKRFIILSKSKDKDVFSSVTMRQIQKHGYQVNYKVITASDYEKLEFFMAKSFKCSFWFIIC